MARGRWREEGDGGDGNAYEVSMITTAIMHENGDTCRIRDATCVLNATI